MLRSLATGAASSRQSLGFMRSWWLAGDLLEASLPNASWEEHVGSLALKQARGCAWSLEVLHPEGAAERPREKGHGSVCMRVCVCACDCVKVCEHVCVPVCVCAHVTV